MHKSRLRDVNGNRYDPKYCDKFKRGKSVVDNTEWGKKGKIKTYER